MTARLLLLCDHTLAEHLCGGQIAAPVATLAAARAYAAEHGWTWVQGRDLCPTHPPTPPPGRTFTSPAERN